MAEDEDVKIGFRTLPLDHPLVCAELERNCARRWSSIMMDEKSRWGRSHLRLYKDREGYFVRQGRRGANKQRLGQCKVTYLNGEPTLFKFTTKSSDDFEADQQRRWDAKHGIDT